MRLTTLLFALAAAGWLLVAQSLASVGLDELPGTWSVDLRPTPDADPYLKTFTIDAIDGNRVTGSFYDTPFDDGVLNADWGTVVIAFTTSDSRTSYHHSAEIDGDQLVGRTHAPDRGFLSVWTGERASDTGANRE